MPLSGSEEFINMLINRRFKDPGDDVIVMKGCEVDGHTLKSSGFHSPIIVPSKQGLRIKVPDSSFPYSDLLKYIDPHMTVDVIDVRNQCEIQMSLEDLIKHFDRNPRSTLLNMLSLEFSRTKLAQLVQPPHAVSELSLVSTCWIEDEFSDEINELDNFGPGISVAPSVQKYCLLSMKGSYTDFHIDFGGSSVWYHVLWGEKIFYLIPPTPENYATYWRWIMSQNNRNIFLPDILPASQTNASKKNHLSGTETSVYKLRVLPGQTILLPSGWIHAVYTVSDCLVFGGNFLNEVHIPMQLSVYRMEQKCDTPLKFMFPNFEKVHWFVAQRILHRLTDVYRHGEEPLPYDMDAAKCLVKVLPRWYKKRRLLPLDEAIYYLPRPNQLDTSLSELINGLFDMVGKFGARSRKRNQTPQAYDKIEDTCPELSDYEDSSTKSSHSPHHTTSLKSGNDSELGPKFDIPYGGLGWVPSRVGKHKSQTPNKRQQQQKQRQQQPITNDPDVLEALPELEDSRLIGDHYYLTLSDSEEEEIEYRKKHRRDDSSSSFKRSPKRQYKNPDPTWTASSPTRRKPSLTRPTPSSESELSNIKLSSFGGKILHPLLHGPSTSGTGQSIPSSGQTPPAPQTSSSSSRTKPSAKQQTTVRQRLAKRLGL